MKYLLLSILFILSSSCGSDEISVVEQPENEMAIPFQPQKVLFIGNSHTYFNEGLDAHLKGFVQHADLPYTPRIEKIASGGFTLEEHQNSTATISALNETEWDIVVLQENTSRAANEQLDAQSSIININGLVQDEKTKIYLFMTWAYEDQPQMIHSIRETYEGIAHLINGTIVPAGLAYVTILQDNHPNIKLYAEDGIHPSLQGTFLTAALFYTAIYNKNPMQNPYTAGLDIEIADYLKEKAMKVYEDYHQE